MSTAARLLRPLYVAEAAVICEAFSCAETRTGSRMRDGALFRHVSLNLLLPNSKRIASTIGMVDRDSDTRVPGALRQLQPILNALATTQEQQGRLLEGALESGVVNTVGLERAGDRRGGRASSRQLAALVNAFARARVWDQALFHRVSQSVRALRPHQVPAQDIAAIVNAFARASTRQNSTFRDGALFLHMSRIAQATACTNIHTRTHTHSYTNTQLHMYVALFVYMSRIAHRSACTYVRTRIHTHLYTNTQLHIYMALFLHMCLIAQARACTYIHTRAHTHSYMHTEFHLFCALCVHMSRIEQVFF